MDEQHQKLAEMLSILKAKNFREELGGYYTYAKEQIKLDKVVDSSGLNALNYNLGRKAGLEMVLNLLQSYEDELAKPALKVK